MTVLTVLEFIEQKAQFHGIMKYNEQRHSFDLEQCNIVDHGIYFFVDGIDILKVGKADGKFGLKGRLNNYRYDNLQTRAEFDRTANRLYTIFEDPKMREKSIVVWVLPVPMVESIFEGYSVQMSRARSLEEQLSRQAEKEGHSLLLSGQH